MVTEVQLQQGDVNIVSISELPTYKIKQKGDNVIRLGSSTGNSHKLVGTFVLYESTGWQLRDVIFADVKSDDCRMVHEEHGTIKLPKGLYQFTPTVEFDHFARGSRSVID